MKKYAHYFVSEHLPANKETYVFVVDDGYVNLFIRNFQSMRMLFSVWNIKSSNLKGYDFKFLSDVKAFRCLRIRQATDLFCSDMQDIILLHAWSTGPNQGYNPRLPPELMRRSLRSFFSRMLRKSLGRLIPT